MASPRTTRRLAAIPLLSEKIQTWKQNLYNKICIFYFSIQRVPFRLVYRQICWRAIGRRMLLRTLFWVRRVLDRRNLAACFSFSFFWQTCFKQAFVSIWLVTIRLVRNSVPINIVPYVASRNILPYFCEPCFAAWLLHTYLFICLKVICNIYHLFQSTTSLLCYLQQR